MGLPDRKPLISTNAGRLKSRKGEAQFPAASAKHAYQSLKIRGGARLVAHANIQDHVILIPSILKRAYPPRSGGALECDLRSPWHSFRVPQTNNAER
jgi:hypothetical protein